MRLEFSSSLEEDAVAHWTVVGKTTSLVHWVSRKSRQLKPEILSDLPKATQIAAEPGLRLLI